ncbi:similar to An14g05470 [Aspergillus luchuensis]|uniref:Similar to An14g05470 n=1 Tax=Aspergillus kawachii TaxID=1069201 RepID=A0A146FWC7_ASPKA|nr:similar to An14g05470 [Aspergillus luchuensis]
MGLRRSGPATSISHRQCYEGQDLQSERKDRLLQTWNTSTWDVFCSLCVAGGSRGKRSDSRASVRPEGIWTKVTRCRWLEGLIGRVDLESKPIRLAPRSVSTDSTLRQLVVTRLKFCQCH